MAATPRGPATPLPPCVLVLSIQGTKDNIQKGPSWLDVKDSRSASSQSGPFWTLSLVSWMDMPCTGGGIGVGWAPVGPPSVAPYQLIPGPHLAMGLSTNHLARPGSPDVGLGHPPAPAGIDAPIRHYFEPSPDRLKARFLYI